MDTIELRYEEVEIMNIHDLSFLLITSIVNLLIPFLVVNTACRISLREFLSEWKRPPVFFVRIFLIVNIIVPLLAIAIVHIFKLPPMVGGILIIVAICPGDPSFLMETKRKGRRLTLAMAFLLMLTFTAPFTIPVWIWVLNQVFPYHLTIKPAAIFLKIFPLVTLPLIFSLILRRYKPELAEKFADTAKTLYRIALIVAGVVAIAAGGGKLASFPISAWIAMFILILTSILLGHISASGGDFEEKNTLAFITALGNPALAILITRVSYPELHIISLICAYVLIRFMMIMPYKLWIAGKLKKA
jgi:BASS family bile acid:Na+ symporter